MAASSGIVICGQCDRLNAGRWPVTWHSWPVTVTPEGGVQANVTFDLRFAAATAVARLVWEREIMSRRRIWVFLLTLTCPQMSRVKSRCGRSGVPLRRRASTGSVLRGSPLPSVARPAAPGFLLGDQHHRPLEADRQHVLVLRDPRVGAAVPEPGAEAAKPRRDRLAARRVDATSRGGARE